MATKENKTIVVELSGKSSVAALLSFIKKAKRSRKKYDFIFSIAYVPSEYEEDSENNIFALGEILKMHAQRYGHNVKEMLYSAEVGVWFNMIKPSLKAKYSGTGSLNSLAYCHLCRLDVAAVNDADILTGERLFHNDKVRANQTSKTFDFFDKYFAKHGIKFIRPFEKIDDCTLVDTLYTEFCKEYGIEVDTYKFPKCQLFGDSEISVSNTRAIENNNSKVEKYLNVLEEHMDNILDEYRYESNKLQ